jgi:hypothetical protein
MTRDGLATHLVNFADQEWYTAPRALGRCGGAASIDPLGAQNRGDGRPTPPMQAEQGGQVAGLKSSI